MSTRPAILRWLLAWLVAIAIGLISASRLAELSADEKAPQSATTGSTSSATVETAAASVKPDLNSAASTAGQDGSSVRQLVSVTKNTPSSVDDLLTIQGAIQQAVERALPATVGISIRGTFGSGVIVSEDGYVLTAGHVVPVPNQTAWIIFPDGKKRVRAKTLGSNGNMDSGMLKIIDEGKYPYVELGRSSELKLGQWCLTLGHPNGMQPDRPPVLRAGRILYARDDAIATDCTIVGGDSGGPLLDVSGRLIGIHSRISDGVTDNFHVPVDTYRDTWDRLARGDVWPPPIGGPLIGVNGQQHPQGCLVTYIWANTPADKAGVKRQDIITHFEGDAVKDLVDLQSLMSRRKPGDEVTLAVLRGEEKLEVKVKLGRRERMNW